MKHSFIVVFLECIAVVMAESKISSIDQCFVCDAVKNIAQTCQKNQEPKMIIEEKIQSFCQQSKPGSKACISNANKYLPFVLDAIIKDGSDLKTCNIITNKTCDNISKMGESENGALACLTCFVGTNLFSRYLLMHEQEIKELMMPICNASILGKNEKEICFDLFDQHFDYTFGAIVTTLSTKVFCGAIIGCPLLKKHEREEITSVLEDVECSACMISFKYLKQFLDNAHAEKYLIKALGTICTSINIIQVSNDCNSLVNKFANELQYMLVKYMAPKNICPKINLCSISDFD